MRVHDGKTQVWDMSGVRHRGVTQLTERRGPQILNSHLYGEGRRCPQNVRASRFCAVLWTTMTVSMLLRIQGIPRVSDVQSTRAQLVYCASARANYILFPTWALLVLPQNSRIAYLDLRVRANPNLGTCLFGQRLTSPQFWQ